MQDKIHSFKASVDIGRNFISFLGSLAGKSFQIYFVPIENIFCVALAYDIVLPLAKINMFTTDICKLQQMSCVCRVSSLSFHNICSNDDWQADLFKNKCNLLFIINFHYTARIAGKLGVYNIQKKGQNKDSQQST